MRAKERLSALAIDDPPRDGGSRLRAKRDRKEGDEGEHGHPSIPVWMFTQGCVRARLTIRCMHGGPGERKMKRVGRADERLVPNTHPLNVKRNNELSGASCYTGSEVRDLSHNTSATISSELPTASRATPRW